MEQLNICCKFIVCCALQYIVCLNNTLYLGMGCCSILPMNFRSLLTAEGQEGPGSPTKIYENLWPVVPKSAISGHSSPPNAQIGASNPLFPDQDQAKICLSNPLSPGQGSAGASRGLAIAGMAKCTSQRSGTHIVNILADLKVID